MATEGEKYKLVELSVVHLRAELEKRGLKNKCAKATLVERLEKVLRDEGHDPEEYLFEMEHLKTLKRSSMKLEEQHTESEMQNNADESHDTTLEVDEDSEEKLENEDKEKIPNAKEKETKNNEKTAKQEEGNDPERKNQFHRASEETKEKSYEKYDSLNNEISGTQEGFEGNGLDNEDSINLTIGEDEEKLLADEDGHEEENSSQEKQVKDEGERGGVNPEEGTAGGDEKKQAAGQLEDKDTGGEDNKETKAQKENKDDKGGDKGKSSWGNTDQKQSRDDKDKHSPSRATGRSRNLWVSGLCLTTRATDLKQVFSKYGEVIGAKVVTNARIPGARCYGYVTMATSEDASKCIQYLHRTELHRRMISVERAKGDAAGSSKKGKYPSRVKSTDEQKRHERKLSNSYKTDEKILEKEEKGESGKSVPGKSNGTKGEEGTTGEDWNNKYEAKEYGENEKVESDTEKEEAQHRRSKDKSCSREVSRDRCERHRSAGSSLYSHHSHHSHHSRPHSRSPHRHVLRSGSPIHRPGVLTSTHIWEETEKQRLCERERDLREDDRRRHEEMARQWEIERRQREEAVRLEREKERLRVERERIAVERAELMRFERARQHLEREKLEHEREELKRQQIRIEEARRTTKRPADDRRGNYPEERKKIVTGSSYEGSRPSRLEDNSR